MYLLNNKYLNALTELMSLTIQVETLFAARGVHLRADASCTIEVNADGTLKLLEIPKEIERGSTTLDYSLSIDPDDECAQQLVVRLYYADNWGMQLMFLCMSDQEEDRDIIQYFFVGHDDPKEDCLAWKTFCRNQSPTMHHYIDNGGRAPLSVAVVLVVDMIDIFNRYPIENE